MKRFVISLVQIIFIVMGAACGPAALPREVVKTVEVQVERPAVVEPVAFPTLAAPLPAATSAPADAGVKIESAPRSRFDRMIIKDANMRLMVIDTDIALDRVTQITEDFGGYIVSSRTWYQQAGAESLKWATVTLSVPSDQFEAALRRLRELAAQVLDEIASGTDVTEEYVDLQSRLKNLEATRDRIRQFLDQAQTVEEALQVNEQLSQVEEEIEQIKGRMNYLSDRAAYSTITVNLEPEPVPYPTPTVTPTPTATPTPTPWTLTPTFNTASKALVSISRFLAQAATWIGVVILPLVGVPLLIILGILWLFRRRDKPAPKKTE